MGEDALEVFSTSWWLCLTMSGICLAFAFLAAGLTMGLISLEPGKLRNLLNVDEAYAKSNEEKEMLRQQKEFGKRVLPIIEDHHRLLVTLLLTNSLANEALPIFLNRLVPAWAAVVLSTTLVLIFGEVIPSAIFTGPGQLAIVSRFSPIVLCFQTVLSVVVRPIASLLDHLLGADHRGPYRQGELVAMLTSDDMEGCVEDDTKKMLLGAVDTERIMVGDEDILTPMDSVFMLPMSGTLDCDTMARILYTGFSRVLVYDHNQHNVRGMLIVKRLIYVDPKSSRKVCTIPLRKMEVFNKDTTLHDALNVFQQGKSHLALVVSNREKVLTAWRFDKPIPPDVHMAGIVTLESILEKILREQIEDEDDRRKAQLLAGAIRSVRRPLSTFDLSDDDTMHQILRACFERWRTEWRLGICHRGSITFCPNSNPYLDLERGLGQLPRAKSGPLPNIDSPCRLDTPLLTRGGSKGLERVPIARTASVR